MAQSWIEQRWLDEYLDYREEQLLRIAAASALPRNKVEMYMGEITMISKEKLKRAGLDQEQREELIGIMDQAAKIGIGMDVDDVISAIVNMNMRSGCKHDAGEKGTLVRFDSRTYICTVCHQKAAAAVMRGERSV